MTLLTAPLLASHAEATPLNLAGVDSTPSSTGEGGYGSLEDEENGDVAHSLRLSLANHKGMHHVAVKSIGSNVVT